MGDGSMASGCGKSEKLNPPYDNPQIAQTKKAVKAKMSGNIPQKIAHLILRGLLIFLFISL